MAAARAVLCALLLVLLALVHAQPMPQGRSDEHYIFARQGVAPTTVAVGSNSTPEASSSSFYTLLFGQAYLFAVQSTLNGPAPALSYGIYVVHQSPVTLSGTIEFAVYNSDANGDPIGAPFAAVSTATVPYNVVNSGQLVSFNTFNIPAGAFVLMPGVRYFLAVGQGTGNFQLEVSEVIGNAGTQQVWRGPYPLAPISASNNPYALDGASLVRFFVAVQAPSCPGAAPLPGALCINGVFVVTASSATVIVITQDQFVEVQSDLVLSDQAKVSITIAPMTNVAPVNVTGSVTLSGELVLILTDSAPVGTIVPIFTASDSGEINGTFRAISIQRQNLCGTPVQDARTFGVLLSAGSNCKSGGLSKGAIAGIVVGSVLGVVLILVLIGLLLVVKFPDLAAKLGMRTFMQRGSVVGGKLGVRPVGHY